MQCNLKKMLPIAATTLVALSSFVYADADSAQLRNLDNRVSALEQRKGASGMINPPGRPQVRDGADLFVYGDLLYWNAHENGLPVAVVETGLSTNLSDAEVKTIHGKWNFGFRVGAGYNMPHDGWDISLTWLRFFDHGRRNVGSDSGTFVFPTLITELDGNFDDDFGTNMSSRWNMHLNQLDLDLGRAFFVSKWLTLRPHFGLRCDWIKQNLTAKYFASEFTGGNSSVLLKDKWFGMGLEGGLDTQWGLGRGWSLFGDMAGAILYGFHRLGYEDVGTSGVTGVFADVSETYRVSHPILDLQLGLRWDNMFDCDRFHLGLQVAWEHHVYFSQNQFPFFPSSTNSAAFVANQGDLTLQGWTFEVRFDF